MRTEYATPTRVSPSQLGPARVSGESDSKEETLPLLTHSQHTPHAAVWDAFARSIVLDCPRCKRLSAAAPSLRCSSSIDCSQTHTSEQFSGWISTLAGIIFFLKCRMLIFFNDLLFFRCVFLGDRISNSHSSFREGFCQRTQPCYWKPPPGRVCIFFYPPPGFAQLCKRGVEASSFPQLFWPRFCPRCVL